MKSPIVWFALALIASAPIEANLAWWLGDLAQQPNALWGGQAVAAEQDNGRQEGPNQERAQDRLQPTITILAEAPGLTPEEVETLVALPIESQVNGMPGVQCVRSASRQGTCSVWVDLEPKTSVFEARQRLAERLQRANLPQNVTPTLAPARFSDREVLLIGLRSTAKLNTAEERASKRMDLYAVAEHVLRNRLLAVPGVSQIVVTGGIRRQCQVELDPDHLPKFGVTVPQVIEALKKKSTVGAGGILRRGPQELPVLVRTTSTVLQDLEAVVVAVHDGVSVRIKDIARVRIGGADRRGLGAIWTKGEAGAHDGPAVILTVLKEPNTDRGKIDRLLSELQPILPPDTELERQTFTHDDVSVSLQLPPGTSRDEQDRVCLRVEAALIEVPEIRSVWRRGPPAEAAESLGWSDGPVIFVALRTNTQRGRESILAVIRERIAEIPGLRASLGQPVSQQLGCAGRYAQIAVKVFGPDLHVLQHTAREIQNRICTVSSVVDLQVEPGGEGPRLQINVKREQAARYGVSVADLNTVVEMGLQGVVVGQFVQEDRRLDLVVMYDEKLDRDADAIRRLTVETAGGGAIPLGSLADFVLTQGPVTVCRENVQRRIVVSCNVQGRDRRAVLTDIREALKPVEEGFPPGYRIEYAGGALAPGS